MRSICWVQNVWSPRVVILCTLDPRPRHSCFQVYLSHYHSTPPSNLSQVYRQHAHEGRAQCLHAKGDDGTMFPRRCYESQHAYRQSLRQFVHGRMPPSICLRMYSVCDSRTMVPGECSGCDHPTWCSDLPLGLDCDSLHRSRPVHRIFHGMINATNIHERTSS
jgi:hypothetical protein